ncbi:MAG: glycosyltransferase [Pelotomaculum sp.]|nr:glycosyltransferase [Pelotomaculum sp.]
MKKILVMISNFNGVGGAETATARFLSKISREKFIIDVCFFGFEDEFALSVKKDVNNIYCFDVKKRGHIWTFFEILKLVKREKYEIIHTHLALADLYGLFLGWLTPVKLISTEHNLSDRRKATLPGRVYYRLAGRRVDYFVGVSSKVVEWLRAAGIPEKKLVLIPNPIEINPKQAAPSFKKDFLKSCRWPEDSTVIGTVANLRPVKGLRYLIDSIKILVDEGVNVRLVIAGEGPERGSLERQIEANRLSGHVRLLGFRKDIENVYSLFDIYVSPSLMEGFGMAIAEAMSRRLPVVSTAAGGVTDFLEHGKNSYLVRPRDPSALAEGIRYFVNNKAGAVKIGETAFIDAGRFRTERLVACLEDLYEGREQNFFSGSV